MRTFYQTISLLLLAAALVACGKVETPPQKFSTVDITGAPWGKDFHLTDHHGQPRSIADFKGKAVVLFFGYINCPDMCPMTMFKLATAVKQLGKDGERVQVLFLTVDPERDTPAVLKQFAPAFHPTFLGMYSDESTIEKTTKDFKVFYEKQKPGAGGFYTVDHMGGSYVYDPQGRLRLFISDEHSADTIAQDLRTLLKG
jgi:protein SCO1/2